MSNQYKRQKLKWKEVGKQDTLKQVNEIIDKMMKDDCSSWGELKQELEKLK